MRARPRVIIESARRWSYFQWFLLGFYELERQGRIDLEIACPLVERSLLWSSSPFFQRIGNRLLREYCSRMGGDSYLLLGRVLYPDGRERSFCIDSADAPFLFDRAALVGRDAYFKIQCPKSLEEEGFRLAADVVAPWCEYAHEEEGLPLTARGRRKPFPELPSYAEKIHPLMIGTRRLSRGNSYRSLKAGYENNIAACRSDKPKRVMCYFGNSQGPRPEPDATPAMMDWDWEADIMGAYAGILEHPNEKRAKMAELIAALGAEADARVISTGVADARGSQKDVSKVVPLEEFCAFVAQFQYNVNISGYRMSIPNRFIDSFQVGTAIFTDALAVKWYLPFEPCEVVETVRMGYEKDEAVDWAQIRRDLENTPQTNPVAIREAFERKWRPDVVAQYIIDTVASGEQGAAHQEAAR